ncbi:M14 family zinc carboxypeptidase [Bizionia echini]|uniref:M14 family zinc carboxypeptidase n=1 Tax=Bizionia echini TaxID=649333 RepID=UPI0030DC3077
MKLIYSQFKILMTLFVFFFACSLTQAQTSEKQKANHYLKEKGELTFTFQVNNHSDVELYSKNFSIVNYNPNTQTVIAWANEKQFRSFESKNIAFQVPTNENEVDEALIYDVRPLASRTSSRATLTFPVNTYPTYAEYAAQMQDFEDDYPGLVEKLSIGTTGQGDKELLFVKISDNVSTDEQEPKIMLTSSMHGDEIAGYPMMLSLINYILTVYGDTGHPDHARVKNLVENAEIWINPSANPDGTYNNSATNTSVAGARRGNANNIDLNRNYPDNVAGPHDDGNAYQTETLAFMALAEANHFVISANFHGGTELVNYPFDNAYVSQYTHPDNDWFEQISVEYATHAQTDANSGSTPQAPYLYKASYMTDDDDSNVTPSPGVTHGAEWYRVYGGRQDYMNFYHQCREITIELSDTKILQESRLDDYWYYNRDALLDFLTQGTYGFRGTVVDDTSGNPIDATITIVGHDAYGSQTVTDISHGDFYRPIKAGTYTILIEAPCYQPVTLTNESIANYQTKDLGAIQLTALTATAPNNLNTAGTDSSSTNASWSATTADSFDLRYRVFGSGTWTNVLGITENPYQITGLTPNTTYEFQVKSYCGSNGTGYSVSEQFTTTNINFCDAQGNSVEDEYIGNVILNGISNNTVSSTNSGYSDLTATTIFGDLDILTNATGNTISVTKYWTGSTYDEAVTVWIDFNQNGTFETAERIFRSSSSTITPVSGTFDIPSNAVLGNTRMRVLMKYYSGTGSNANDPCETFNYGEVEDYTLNITNSTLATPDFEANAIKVFPNPFNNSLHIKLIDNNSVDIKVFDISGRVVSTRNNIQPTNQNITLNNFESLTVGTYFIQINNKKTNQTVVKRVIKQ